MMKLYIIIGVLLVVIFNANSQSKNQTVDGYPIVGWYGIPPQESTLVHFQDLRDAGITHNLAFYYTEDQISEALDVAEKVGVKLIISYSKLLSDPEEVARKFMNHPSLAGYFLKDEPDVRQYEYLRDIAKRILSVDKKHFCYVNLYPNYAPLSALYTSSYREYVRLCLKIIPLQFLSFDNYPILLDPSKKTFIREDWYENLEIVLNETQKVGKPFWAFALLTPHGGYPAPTLAEIRVQIFSNLAYGAQGLQYFTYWTPGDGSNPRLKAAIDNVTRNKTERYYTLKEINQEIKNILDKFVGAKVISVFHTGATIPKGTKRLERLPKIIKTLETEGLGAVVSYMNKEKESYLVIVNRDIRDVLKLKIEGEGSLKRILKDGTSISLKSGINDFEIPPGDVLIYTWKTK